MNGAQDQQSRINGAISDFSRSSSWVMVGQKQELVEGERDTRRHSVETGPLLGAGAGKCKEGLCAQSSTLAVLSSFGFINAADVSGSPRVSSTH